MVVAAEDQFGLAGQVLDGQFRVDEHIGEGGFSVVYRGTHVGLREPIAIKCMKLPPALGSALVESFIKRFRDESRIHYRLSQGHLHIARCLASGTTVAPATSSLVPYTVLEWLEGRSLASEFEDRRSRGLRGRPLVEVIRLLDSAIDALAYAHAQGVVHRDLNPGNLFLANTPAGEKLKVLDFGVAKVMADAAIAMGPGARTLGNIRIFTPAYGAPEQFDESVGAIGPWTDVYAVALVVLEAMIDRTVVEGEHIGELAAVALHPIRRLTPRALGIAVGDEVEAALARAVALWPAERPRDAGELWGTLKHAIAADDAATTTGTLGRPAVMMQPAAIGAGAASFGSTVRMPSAPRRASPVQRPLPNERTSLAPSPGDPGANLDLAASQPSSFAPTSRRTTRISILIFSLLALLALGALIAAWLFSPRIHAEAGCPVAEKRC